MLLNFGMLMQCAKFTMKVIYIGSIWKSISIVRWNCSRLLLLSLSFVKMSDKLIIIVKRCGGNCKHHENLSFMYCDLPCQNQSEDFIHISMKCVISIYSHWNPWYVKFFGTDQRIYYLKNYLYYKFHER